MSPSLIMACNTKKNIYIHTNKQPSKIKKTNYENDMIFSPINNQNTQPTHNPLRLRFLTL